MDQTTAAAIMYAAETGAIVRIQWGIGLIGAALFLGILLINSTLRRRNHRAKDIIAELRADAEAAKRVSDAKIEVVLKEQRRLRRLLENTEKALVAAKETIDTLEIEKAYRKGRE